MVLSPGPQAPRQGNFCGVHRNLTALRQTRPMFGPRLTSVFASRWKALWWAAGVLTTAYCSIPPADDTATADDPGTLQAEAPAAPHQNPWS